MFSMGLQMRFEIVFFAVNQSFFPDWPTFRGSIFTAGILDFYRDGADLLKPCIGFTHVPV